MSTRTASIAARLLARIDAEVAAAAAGDITPEQYERRSTATHMAIDRASADVRALVFRGLDLRILDARER